MTKKEIACPSSDNTCRTIKATYLTTSTVNILSNPDRGGHDYKATGVIYIYE